jgi:hypothetical protein
MKQTIRQVLDELGDTQINLGSEAARETIASLVSAALKTKGTYTEYTDEEIEKEKVRETWVCQICDENTFDVDYDYIGSGANHLSCELGISDDFFGLKEKSNKKSSHVNESFDTYSPYNNRWKDGVRIVDDAGVDIETGKATFPEMSVDTIQKQVYNEMTADGLPPGGDAQAVKESHKLAEEIVNAKKGDWIYESPDGGKTVFRRPFSDTNPENKEEIDWETKEPTGRKFSEYNNGHWEKGNEG